MGQTNFDPRYPAEFQRGGDSLPWVATAESDSPQFDSAQREEQVSVAANTPDQNGAQVATGPAEREASEVAEQVQLANVPTRWTARIWLVGLGAGVVTILFGIFCLLPNAPHGDDSTGANYMSVALFFPLPNKWLALGPFILLAGLGMIVTMLIAGAPRHPKATRWLRSAAALLAIGALSAATFSLYATTWHPEIVFSMYGDPRETHEIYPWLQLTYLSTMPLALFGLCAGAAVVILRPTENGKNAPSAVHSFATGIVLLVGTAVAFNAPEIFFSSMGPKTFTLEDANMQLTPWPVTLIQVAPYLLLVGLAAMLLALFLQFRKVGEHRVVREAAVETEPLDSGAEHGSGT